MSEIGTMIDRMAELDREVDKLQAKIKELNRKRSIVEGKLMKAFDKQKMGKASGRLANASLGMRRHPSIKDMSQFNSYVLKNKALDLFQRRINSKAYFDRLAEGDAVPGVEIYEHHFIKITPKRG